MFQPPYRDYLEENTIAWEATVCNFSQRWLAGTLTIDCPEDWLVEPGRRQSFFMRGDQTTHTLPCRIWTGTTSPGLYRVKTSVQLPGITNTMTCLIEQFPEEPVVALWTFESPETSMTCTNRPADVSQGIWRSDSTATVVPRLYASLDTAIPATARDVSIYRIRLSGDQDATHSRIRWICKDENGVLHTVERTVQLPVDSQWHTCVFPVGRELGWRGTPVMVKIKPVFDPGITVELDDVRLVSPPPPAEILSTR
jgi:hypothetical protein